MSNMMETTVNNLVRAVAQHSSVRAIGWSGDEQPIQESGEGDIDLFVYCTEIPTRHERQEILMSLHEAIERVEVGKLENGPWGQSDSLWIAGVETWLLYFTVAETHRELDDILHGKYLGRLDTYYYPIGRCAMWKTIRVLYDPDGFLQSIKDRLNEYPQELSQTVINYHLKALEDVEDLERAVQRKDVLFFHFAMDLALDHYLQALFALNKEYFPSRKRTESFIRGFEVKPADCEKRLREVVTLGGNAETLEQAYKIWSRLVDGLDLLIKKRQKV